MINTEKGFTILDFGLKSENVSTHPPKPLKATWQHLFFAFLHSLLFHL